MSATTETVGTVYRYRVDDRDHVVRVSDNWDDFARENGAPPDCLAENLLGTRLWDHVVDGETRRLYLLVTDGVRRSGRAVTVPINCDAPGLVRSLDVRIAPADEAGALDYTCTVTRLVPRDPLALLEPSRPRTADSLPICSFCKGIEVADGRWEDTATAVAELGLFRRRALPELANTICPRCETAILTDLP